MTSCPGSERSAPSLLLGVLLVISIGPPVARAAGPADPQPRYRPSTAAGLNLAAAAAQGARLFERYDRRLAAKLLRASATAYAAAERTPDLYAPAPDAALDPNPGSGPYDDDDMSDEFYWAAAELCGGRTE